MDTNVCGYVELQSELIHSRDFDLVRTVYSESDSCSSVAFRIPPRIIPPYITILLFLNARGTSQLVAKKMDEKNDLRQIATWVK